MARYTINQSDEDLTIRVTETGPGADQLLTAFRECQQGRCDCPTDEYEKVSTLDVESEEGDTITLRLVPKPGQRFDESEIDADDRWGRQNQQIARISLEDLTDATLSGVFGQMIDEGAAESSRGRMLSSLRGLCRWLEQQGYLDSDPTRNFETPQTPDRLPVALSDEQLARVVQAAANPERRLHAHWASRDVAMIGVLAGCGIRSEELCGLRIEQVQRAEPHRLTVTGKGDKQRTLPLSTEVLAATDKYLEERTSFHEGGDNPEDFVFVRTNGRSLNNQALQHLIANWLAAAGISPPPGEKAHLFRHTYAVGQIDRGTSIAELQTLLGHKNIATTSIYLRVAAEGLHHTARATAVNALIQQALFEQPSSPPPDIPAA